MLHHLLSKSALCAFLCVSALMATPIVANAKTTVIKFPRGSYCSSFTGDYAGRTFTLNLGARQTLTVMPSGGVRDVIVKNPRGQIMEMREEDNGSEADIRRTTMKGTHKITLRPFDRNDTYASVQFCAY